MVSPQGSMPDGISHDLSRVEVLKVLKQILLCTVSMAEVDPGAGQLPPILSAKGIEWETSDSAWRPPHLSKLFPVKSQLLSLPRISSPGLGSKC